RRHQHRPRSRDVRRRPGLMAPAPTTILTPFSTRKEQHKERPMTSFDTYYVTEEDARQVEATWLDLWGSLPYWAAPTAAATPLGTAGPPRRGAAALQSVPERSDGHATRRTGTPSSQPVKGNEFPISGGPLFGSGGRRSRMAVTWESAGGLWSDRAWQLDATLHIEVDLTYGDTHVSLTGVRLRVTGRTACGTVFTGDDG